ncbi:putative Maleylacetate reductase [Ophiobolus disseminans]|uniref:Putative Maleylacetate reductase n=1 Tax=Ophiobolus disseminans TaxID=1469910 RepID=A0A6A7A4V0_9PLEO|nr:putative Maleylacetate reductase [Ophiobolus disseminans]
MEIISSAAHPKSTLFGLWQPRINLNSLYYGPGCVQQHILDAIPTISSKVFIVTGSSLATKTPLVRQLEAVLGIHHAGTISNIRQHGPLEDVEQAIDLVLSRADVDTIVSLGGGSPIDTAKVMSFKAKEKRGKPLTHIAIPTTLSAAECTAGGGYTTPDGVKVGFREPDMGVSIIFYDPQYARYTPKSLWLSTGMRAMDHAVECMYHPTAAEVPWKALSLWAASELFECLPKARDTHPHDEFVIGRLMLAAYASSGLKGANVKGGMGLSHSLGHALGSPYGIPHGITSCMTLGKAVKLKAEESRDHAQQIARLLPAAGGRRSGDNMRDAMEVGERIVALVKSLEVGPLNLLSWNVSKEETTVIVERALGGVKEGEMFDNARGLVESLF